MYVGGWPHVNHTPNQATNRSASTGCNQGTGGKSLSMITPDQAEFGIPGSGGGQAKVVFPWYCAETVREGESNGIVWVGGGLVSLQWGILTQHPPKAEKNGLLSWRGMRFVSVAYFRGRYLALGSTQVSFSFFAIQTISAHEPEFKRIDRLRR